METYCLALLFGDSPGFPAEVCLHNTEFKISWILVLADTAEIVHG